MWVTKDASFLYTKRGTYYFSRRVPQDLKGHYKSPRIAVSLRTKSKKVARARALTLAARLDEDWLTLRWKSTGDPLQRLLHQRLPGEITATSEGITLTEAKELLSKRRRKAGPPPSYKQRSVAPSI